MKIKKLLWTSVLCLCFASFAMADGDPPIGNRSDPPPPPPPSIVQLIINLLIGK